MHTGLQANCVPAQILEVISYFIEACMCGQFGSRLAEPLKPLDSRLLRSHTLCELLFSHPSTLYCHRFGHCNQLLHFVL